MKYREPVRISDHAVLRYMERAMGLNVELVREHIQSLCGPAAALGASSLRVCADGVRFEIVNNAVTTCVPDRVNPSKTSIARNQRTIERTERDRLESNLRIDLRPHLQHGARTVETDGIVVHLQPALRDPGHDHTFVLGDALALGDAFAANQVPSGD